MRHLVLAGVLLLTACSVPREQGSGGDIPVGHVGSGGYTPGPTSGAAAGGFQPDPYVCEPRPIPHDVPKGWKQWLDWTCNCPFYLPGSKDLMPAPIEWVACPASVGDMDCRLMKLSWPYTPAKNHNTPIALGAVYFDHDPDGSGVLGFRRITDNTDLLDLVVPVDGPVRAAILKKWIPGQPESDPGCVALYEDMNEGRWSFTIHGDNDATSAEQSKLDGAMGGTVDDLRPTVLHHADNGSANVENWGGGAQWVYRASAGFLLQAFSPDMSTSYIVTHPALDPDGMHANSIHVRDSAIFWETRSQYVNGINVWEKDKGARPFVRWPGIATKGAGNFGTDKIDMVWLQGEKPADYDHYPKMDVMTAPFTADPDEIVATRVRSSPHQYIVPYPFKVGCGYAAHGDSHLILVRLSDGVMWEFQTDANTIFGPPVGVTCDDLFILGAFTGDDGLRVWNIARIKISSLGPGIPAD